MLVFVPRAFSGAFAADLRAEFTCRQGLFTSQADEMGRGSAHNGAFHAEPDTLLHVIRAPQIFRHAMVTDRGTFKTGVYTIFIVVVIHY
jgi:hypothetical protein